jgi:hypothetical protein
LSFDGTREQPDADDDVTEDVAQPVNRCGDPVTPPATLHLTGETFTFGNSQGATNPQTSVSVAVRDRVTHIDYATTISDPSAVYSVDVPTMGHALDVELVYSRTPDLFTTTVFLDRPLARDLTGNVSVWNEGNGSLWGNAEITVVYDSAGDGTYRRDPLKGTITFEMRDCAGVPIGGARVTLTPAAQVVFYQTSANGLDGSGTATESVYGSAVAFNSAVGTVHVETTAPGFSFDPIDITVSPDQAMDMAVLRGY